MILPSFAVFLNLFLRALFAQNDRDLFALSVNSEMLTPLYYVTCAGQLRRRRGQTSEDPERKSEEVLFRSAAARFLTVIFSSKTVHNSQKDSPVPESHRCPRNLIYRLWSAKDR